MRSTLCFLGSWAFPGYGVNALEQSRASRLSAYFDEIDAGGNFWYTVDISTVDESLYPDFEAPSANVMLTKIVENLLKPPDMCFDFDDVPPNIRFTPVIQRSYGYEDFAHGVEASATTRYRAASLAKPFTATMIFQLIDERKLRLDQHLSDFFPKMPNADKITIAHLLAHESGIANHTDVDAFWDDPEKEVPRDKVLESFYIMTPKAEPGETLAYSNTGYMLLGFIIERLDGSSYDEALQARIANKIGLRDTYLDMGREREARPYAKFRNDMREMKRVAVSKLGAAAALVSTARDLKHFIVALLSGKLVSKDSLEKMKTPRTLSVPEKDAKEPHIPMGMGLQLPKVGGRQGYGHIGNVDSYKEAMFFFPATRRDPESLNDPASANADSAGAHEPKALGVTYVILANFADKPAGFNMLAMQHYMVPMHLFFGLQKPKVPDLTQEEMHVDEVKLEKSLIPQQA